MTRELTHDLKLQLQTESQIREDITRKLHAAEAAKDGIELKYNSDVEELRKAMFEQKKKAEVLSAFCRRLVVILTCLCTQLASAQVERLQIVCGRAEHEVSVLQAELANLETKYADTSNQAHRAEVQIQSSLSYHFCYC